MIKAWYVARAFMLRGLHVATSYRFDLVFRLANLVVSLAALYFLARFVDAVQHPLLARYGQSGYLGYGLIGAALLNLQHVILQAFPQTVREAQLMGTVEAMLTTPTPEWMVLIFMPLYRVAAAVAKLAFLLLVAHVALGLDLSRANIATLLVVVPLGVATFAALGLLSAAFTMWLRQGDPLATLLSASSLLASAVFYPTEVLPEPLRALAHALPLTHLLEGVRQALFNGASLADVAGHLVALAAFAAVTVPLGFAAFSFALRRARVDGGLSYY